MIPISLNWDTQKKLVFLRWNGFVSSEWEGGKIVVKILGMSIPLKKEKIQLPGRLPIRWIYLKGFLSFVTKWKIKKVEGTLSFPDPMINGILYGWMSAIQAGKGERKIDVTVNFLGENGCRGEATLPLKIFFRHLRSWISLLIRETKGKKVRKGGES
jgi:hypothetical protein